MFRGSPDFEIFLKVKRPGFLPAPRRQQRNWLLRRSLDELAAELRHLDQVCGRLVAGSPRPPIRGGWEDGPAHLDDSSLLIEGQQVMMNWEEPLMRALARNVAEEHGDVLEVGFGMGISATFLQDAGVRSHTIIECNRDVIKKFESWRDRYPDRDIRLMPGRWEDVINDLGIFDAILFDTYPTDEAEFLQHVMRDITYAEHFFPHAAAHLRPCGVFSYYTNEIDSFSRGHQRRLLDHFGSLTLEIVDGLRPPEDCSYWWADTMVVAKAVR